MYIVLWDPQKSLRRVMVEDNFITILLTQNLGPIYRADPGLLAYTHTHTHSNVGSHSFPKFLNWFHLYIYNRKSQLNLPPELYKGMLNFPNWSVHGHGHCGSQYIWGSSASPSGMSNTKIKKLIQKSLSSLSAPYLHNPSPLMTGL